MAMLATSCSGLNPGSSSSSSSTPSQTESVSASSSDVSETTQSEESEETTPEESSKEATTSKDDGWVAEEIQIGGNMKAFPERIWNPEAATPDMCFKGSQEDRNIYNITVDLKKGDVILFFFNYSWDKAFDYNDVDWNYYEGLPDVASYVSDKFEGEDINKKKTEIHILKDGRFTFSYHTFGKILKQMKTGMVLTALE